MMIFVVIIGGAMSGAKSVGFGIWYWGYTAWKMYKRDNDSLVSLQKFMLWFEAIAFSIALAVLLLSDSNARRFVDINPLELVILASISMSITYGLFVFFKKQSSSSLIIGSSDLNSTSSIDDKYWEAASNELALKRNEAAWAKAFAISDGDEAKAKAMYIKNRALDFKKADAFVAAPSVSSQSTNVIKSVYSQLSLSWKSLNYIGKIVIFGIVALIVHALIDDDHNKGGSHYYRTPASISIDRGSSWQSSVSELRRGISDGTISVRTISAEVIASELDVLDKPWNRYRATLPTNLVSTVEEKNIWWSTGDKFYIRLYNPSEATFLGFNFSIADSKCSISSSNKILIHFDLRNAPLLPFSYDIYSASWPFDYSKVFGSGTKCGIVTTVLTQK
jgi:hypothetical protein